MDLDDSSDVDILHVHEKRFLVTNLLYFINLVIL